MYGLVLGGGGARGAYQIGVYKALMELGIEIKAITGTSIGAVNGAIIAQGDFEKAYDMWHSIDGTTFFDVEKEHLKAVVEKDIKWSNVEYWLKKGASVVKNKGIETEKMLTILKDIIDEDRLRKNNFDFGLITYSISNLKPHELKLREIPKGQLPEYVMASAGFPGFKTIDIDGKTFIDGGIYDNLPIKLMRSMGYRKIIAVSLTSNEFRKVDKDVILIKPRKSLGRILNFNQAKNKERINLGYYDTLKEFNKLKGLDYYIKPHEDKEYYKRALYNLEVKSIRKLCKIYGIKGIPEDRALYEYIIPKIIEMLELDKSSDYEDVMVAIFEQLAEHLNIRRFKIYEAQEFMDIVEEKYINANKPKSGKIATYVLKRGMPIKLVKKEVLFETMNIIFNK